MLSNEAAQQLRQHKEELLARLSDGAARAPATAFGAGMAASAAPIAQRIPMSGNILGVGYGAKLTDGRVSEVSALRVYVKAKLPRRRLRQGEEVPEEVGTMLTDVVPVGDVTVFDRPVRSGVSIGHPDSTAGTLGCLVRIDGTEEPSILSNNHVMAGVNRAAIGDPILEPGPADGGTEAIAELSDFEPIKPWGEANRIDAAVARVFDPADVEPDLEVIGSVQNPPLEAALYQSVRKHGRTTQHTVGVVMDVSADLWVRVRPQELAWFEDQIAVVGVGGDFSQPGDSGSLVVDGVTRAPVGLLFAGGDGHTFVNPIDLVLARFGATILNGAVPG